VSFSGVIQALAPPVQGTLAATGDESGSLDREWAAVAAVPWAEGVAEVAWLPFGGVAGAANSTLGSTTSAAGNTAGSVTKLGHRCSERVG